MTRGIERSHNSEIWRKSGGHEGNLLFFPQLFVVGFFFGNVIKADNFSQKKFLVVNLEKVWDGEQVLGMGSGYPNVPSFCFLIWEVILENIILLASHPPGVLG